MIIVLVILFPCIFDSFEIIPSNVSFLAVPFIVKRDSLQEIAYIDETESSVSIFAHSVYNNLQDKDTLISIKKDLVKLGGVYTFVHNESKRQYIGSSVNLARRISDHLSNKDSNIHLQRAISKYDISNFSLYVLELLPTDEDLTSEELSITLIKMEQKYLDYFKDKYNINPKAGKTRLGAKHSEASKELMSVWRKENPAFLNKTHSPEVIAAMRARATGSNNPMFGKPVTESNKMLLSNLYSKSVYLYDANTLTLIDKYSKHKDLVDYLGISSKTLIKYKDSGKVLRDKYIISSTDLNPKDT